MLNKLKNLFKEKSPKRDLLCCGRCDHIWDTGLHTKIYKNREGYVELVIDCPSCHPQVMEGIVAENIAERLEELNKGDKIRALIRHSNPEMGLPDSYVFLTNDERGFCFDNNSELNYNWDIINFELIKEN